MLVTKTSENHLVVLKGIPSGRNEDYDRNAYKEQMILDQEKKQDLRRQGKFENDLTRLTLYDF